MNYIDSLIPLLVGLYLAFFSGSLIKPGNPSFITARTLRLMGVLLIAIAIALFLAELYTKK
jgi:hypothetical protein